MAIYLSMVKAVNDRAEAFIARNWQNTIREQPTDPHTHMSPADNNDDDNDNNDNDDNNDNNDDNNDKNDNNNDNHADSMDYPFFCSQ